MQSHKTTQFDSGIRDNRERGKVADFLKEKLKNGSKLSFVSAYFTIYAYDALKDQLDKVDNLRFLFGEPRFVNSLDPKKTDKKTFKIEDEGLSLNNRLKQKRVAKECHDWLLERLKYVPLLNQAFFTERCIILIMMDMKMQFWEVLTLLHMV